MVRLLGLNRGGDQPESPREITRTSNLSSEGENGWLIRFFDSAFFCEWIAVSYLYKHDHPGVRDYLCNRMYTLPLSGIESYLFQICYMLVHKPSPSLDKFVIDMCTKSLQIALKVHWFLMAELEDSDDNDGISRIQEKCQIAATLMGDWPPLIRPPPPSSSSPVSKLNKLLSSKQRLLSLTSSPPPTVVITNLQEEVSKSSSDENKLFKKFIPGPKVRDALLFRKSVEKVEDKDKDKDKDKLVEKGDEDDSEKDGFFRRLLRDSKDEDDSEKDGFFRRLIRDSKDDDDSEVLSTSSEGIFKRLFRDSNKNDSEEKAGSKSIEEDDEKGFFKKILRDSKEEDEDGFFKKLFRDNKNDIEEKIYSKSAEEDVKEGFFRKLFKDKSEDKKDGTEKNVDEDKGNDRDTGEDEPSDFPLFRRIFRVHPEDTKVTVANENGNTGGSFDSSPGTESFFRKLFRDRDRSVEDSELFGSKKHKEKRPGSPKQQTDTSHPKPPLPNNITSQIRKGAYHVSLDFVQSLCDTSYGLVDIFPIEDRKSALHESLTEINTHIAAAQNSGGVCFPMGKGMYRVVYIPEDEAVLLNSREKAPYLICVEVLKGEVPRSRFPLRDANMLFSSSHTKDTPTTQKLSRGGIPLANGDAQLPKPPPWAYPLWSSQDVYLNGTTDRMLRSTSQAIDQAMAHLWETKVKFVHVSLSAEKQSTQVSDINGESEHDTKPVTKSEVHHDLEWVRAVLTADPGVNMEDIEDQEPPRRKEHRRIPSTIAIEEVKAAAAKGQAPPGLPLKGAGQDSSDAQPKVANGGVPRETDALSGELWEVKKERICKSSIHGKSPGWDLRSVIVKSGDDCRQEHLAVQLVSHFYVHSVWSLTLDIFQEAGLPLWLRPYEVLVTSSYTALIETIPDTASIHSIKTRFPSITSLRQFFMAKYEENSPSFKLAQRNFVESMAGYSILCYLLQVKDRHNGNLLMDEEGHIIHIDFGFMLSNSPGGVNFESAPFKLTRELLEVMDSDAEGVPSEFFDYFKVLCIQGFLTCRKHAERIILLVEMMQDSDYPCFKGGQRTILNLRKRFHLSLTEEQCVSLVLSLISNSLDAWRTRQYDYYQRVLNGIL
ncbi:hypothetical protein GIB67_031889 [Kingdonia uniflora]|uniref:1-phosphatidylinositol 4-kinase n=1 Tax=Kingdonia uniflora TaxID=39325 RepID=A0A7J7NTI8_9MAGN|nr:hypothetical protein GIB67_031889 [Kingdonia uniflora]